MGSLQAIQEHISESRELFSSVWALIEQNVWSELILLGILLGIPFPFIMKVLDANAGLLSNFEVMNLLRSRGATQDPLGSSGSATRSECQVFDYLVQSPAGTLTEDIVRAFLLKAEKFSLTKAERLQVLNLRPSTAVEVHMIIEDCEERMSSSTVDEFLEMVKSTLPPPPMKPQVEDEEENDEADEKNDEAGEGNDGDMHAEEEVE